MEGRGLQQNSFVGSDTVPEVNSPQSDSSKKVGGRLKFYLDNWREITNDKYILGIVSGLSIPFKSEPVQNFNSKEISFNSAEARSVSAEICRLLDCNAISKVEPCDGQFLSSIFCVPKANGNHRLIINLKGLNEFVKCPHYKMEDIRMACNLLRKGYYMAKIDIQDAYLHVPIDDSFKKFLRFKWNGEIYEYQTLPFGLNIAPVTFTKLLRPIFGNLRAQGHQSVVFLDDCLLLADTKHSCTKNVNKTLHLLESLGFVVNKSKCVFEPSQLVTFLGFIFDTVNMIIRLPQDKIRRYVKMCESILKLKRVTIQSAAELQGTLISASPAVKYGKLYTRQLAIDINNALLVSGHEYAHEFSLSEDSKEDIRWWTHSLSSSGNNIYEDSYDCELIVDASTVGWGAVCGNVRTRGSWNKNDKTFHINILELLAIENAMYTFIKESNVKVLIRSDNTTAIAYVNKFGGCHSKALLSIAKRLWKWCEANGHFMTASHIPGSLNTEADYESRVKVNSSDWSLSDTAFKTIVQSLGQPDIDLFATIESRKVDKYVSQVTTSPTLLLIG